MVYIALISLITLALLTALVFGLHRYQLSMAQTNADKHNPLPSLEKIKVSPDLPDLTLDDYDLESNSQSAAQFRAASGTRTDQPAEQQQHYEKTEIIVPAHPAASERAADNRASFESAVVETIEEHQAQHYRLAATLDTSTHSRSVLTNPEPEAPDIETASVTDRTVANSGQESVAGEYRMENQAVEDATSGSSLAFLEPSVAADSWQERVAELKKQGRLDEALDVCRQEYPLWSAYQQASLIHRAKIKQPDQNEAGVVNELAALYKLASEASFLHDRVKGLPNLSLAQLKLLDLSPIEELEMPYSKIGYTELRLIKKTDIKLLLDYWGKPETHIKPREFHADTWRTLCGDTQSTLF